MKYLAISAKVVDADNYVAWFADPLPATATGATRAEALKKLQDMITDAYFCTKATVTPQAQSLDDVESETLEGSEEIETAWLELGYINPVAYTLWEAMNQAQISPSELGRRMNITRAAAHKLLDPNRSSPYSLDTLERIAAALGMQLEPPRFIPSVPTPNAFVG
jgi:DNA-binding Xre family transcriptional regulator